MFGNQAIVDAKNSIEIDEQFHAFADFNWACSQKVLYWNDFTTHCEHFQTIMTQDWSLKSNPQYV